MQLLYDPNIERYFVDYERMQKRIGKDITRAVKNRINQLLAADNLAIYLSLGLGKTHLLTGDLKGLFSVHVSASQRLIFQPITSDQNAESIRKCDQVIIKGVLNYHGEKYEWLIP